MKNQQINSNGTPPVEDGLVSISLDGVIKEWNRGAEKIFGYSAEEALEKPISLILCEEVFKKEKAIVRNLKKNLEQHYEAECKDKNDKKIFVSFTAFPAKDEMGKVNLISQVVKDVTQQKIAEEKQATLAAIVNFSDDAIISKTLDGIITSWNRSATKMFGFTEKQALGKHISIIIPKDRLDEETVIINNIRKGKRIEHFETIRVAKDGAKRNISLTVSPLKNSNGKIIGASKIARDISIRIEAEKQRETYTERLQELNNYKDDFMVMASHELKTPLTVILANLHILEMKMENDPNKDFLIKTTRQVNKLSSLVTNLLDVSKIQAGKLALNLSLFDMNILIEEISSNLQQTTKNHRITFNNNHKKLMIYADHERMEQVLINIISNAIKYSPESDKIVVDATKKDKYILVDVYDNGIGIPDKDIENIFLRFYRVSGSASSFSGSGVGLYISSEIIKHHGGKIWAESEIKKGSVFHFTIPAAKNLS
ncbi:MAG: PAS domain-containing sensor histidine kinase [Ginsengibacter sp.]